MTDTLDDVVAADKQEPAAPVLDEQGLAEQLVAQARAKGVDLVGPDGLLVNSRRGSGRPRSTTAAGRLVAAERARVAPSAEGTAEIGRLTVTRDQQGLGAGLVAALEAELPGTVTEMRLFTGEHSESDLRLYARAGYTETGREPTGAGYSLVHLSKPPSASR